MPVVAEKENDILLEVGNDGAEMASGEIQLHAPAGWKLKNDLLKFRVLPGKMETLHLWLTPPMGMLADADIIATRQSGKAKASARAHPVPRTFVPHIRSAPTLDATDTGWLGVPAISIPETNVVQGKVRDASDSSARIRLAHNGQSLFVDIDVKDDVVVTNIAPNDIRGHWRSDSVEICIDPVGGAENTMGCFKAGIFPFDTTGVVRAARDADANQGPIEETAPKMRVVSKRTPDGYRIQAEIPFREIGITSRHRKGLGFNVIINDGDKADASIGENINKSRIAWAPRSGVQGRPEDWGRIDLE